MNSLHYDPCVAGDKEEENRRKIKQRWKHHCRLCDRRKQQIVFDGRIKKKKRENQNFSSSWNKHLINDVLLLINWLEVLQVQIEKITPSKNKLIKFIKRREKLKEKKTNKSYSPHTDCRSGKRNHQINLERIPCSPSYEVEEEEEEKSTANRDRVLVVCSRCNKQQQHQLSLRLVAVCVVCIWIQCILLRHIYSHIYTHTNIYLYRRRYFFFFGVSQQNFCYIVIDWLKKFHHGESNDRCW